MQFDKLGKAVQIGLLHSQAFVNTLFSFLFIMSCAQVGAMCHCAQGLCWNVTSVTNELHLMYNDGPLMVAQQLKYCATDRKVAGSIPDGITGIFHWHNAPYRTVALGFTQPLTEMSTRSISWG
jgi:hypothetical protein